MAVAPLILGAAAGAAGGAAAAPVIQSIMSAITPDMYVIQMGAWQESPRLIPPAEAIAQSYIRGTSSWLGAGEALKLHGIDATAVNGVGHLWRAWVSMQWDYPSPGTQCQLWASRIWDARQLTEGLRRTGAAGEWWQYVAAASLAYPTSTEALVLRNRDLATDQGLNILLDRNKLVDGPIRDAYIRLRHQIPGQSDLVRYMVREAFDEGVVAAMGYDESWPNPMLVWAGKQGYGWRLGDEPGFVGPNPDLTWAQCEWRAHWQPAAPTQAYTMGHRLRPGKPGLDPRLVTPQSGPGMSVETMLRIADYAPEVRRRLMAISYTIPTRNDLMQLWRHGVITDRQELLDGLLDTGFDPRTAPLVADMIIRQSATLRLSNPIGLTRSRIEQLYRIGSVSQAEASDMLVSLAFTADEASLILLSVDAAIRAEYMRQAVAGVRRRVLLGEYDLAEAQTALRQVGVDPGRIPSYIAAWSWEVHIRRDHGSLRILRRMARQGVVTMGELVYRLRRVGYDDSTISAIVRSIELDRQSDEAREISRQQAAIERQRKAMAAQAQRERVRIQRIYTIPRMRLYLRDGTMPEREIRDILSTYYQWDATAIDRELATWSAATGQVVGREPP